MSCMRWLTPHRGWAGAGDPKEGLMISINHFPVEKCIGRYWYWFLSPRIL
ncbi:hypothetical protein PITC_077780 [Penicillium italicum]|uniref:Uncharacterized protein n=1 Tax=Penicillium italicum TaxID=40296 RepID=A0A0A2KMD5_PENIT|nr:hypothetical protein PITC_077780 [Penicillium italicum]